MLRKPLILSLLLFFSLPIIAHAQIFSAPKWKASNGALTPLGSSQSLSISDDVSVGKIIWIGSSLTSGIRDASTGDLEFTENGGSSWTDFGTGSGGGGAASDVFELNADSKISQTATVSGNSVYLLNDTEVQNDLSVGTTMYVDKSTLKTSFGGIFTAQTIIHAKSDSAQLRLEDTSAGSYVNIGATDTGTGLNLDNNLSPVGNQSVAFRLFRNTKTTGNRLFDIMVGDNTNTTAIRLSPNLDSYLSTSGNFAIGTTTATYTLTLADEAASACNVSIKRPGSSSLFLQNYTSGGQMQLYNTGADDIWIATNNSISQPAIMIEGDGGFNDGWIGINNTTTPLAPLHVTGDTIISNDLTVGNDLTVEGNLRVGTTGSGRLVDGYFPINATIMTPTTGNYPVASLETTRTPNGFVLHDIGLTGDLTSGGTQNVSGFTYYEYTSATDTSPSLVEDYTSVTSNKVMDDGTLSDPDIAADAILMLHLTVSGSPDYVIVTGYGSRND